MLNPLLLTALAITGAIALWGILDTGGLAAVASRLVDVMFRSRGWFIMLTVSVQAIVCTWLVFSRYAGIRLGRDDEEPEFSTVSWLTMLFAAGMGVGLLYWGAAEPITHFLVARDYAPPSEAASRALFITNFHWGLHAWAVYGLTGLVIAYFGFRRGCPQLMSAPLQSVFGTNGWTRSIGGLCDLLAIVAIAIGLGGSVAMGVFQVQQGMETLLGIDGGRSLALGVFVVVCLVYFPATVMDLGKGMAVLSNVAMGVALSLLVFLLLAGPTSFLMNGVTEAIGRYATGVFPQGFRTYTFFDSKVTEWFSSWTLSFMVWWLAWAPFVGVFIARISRGRTIREYLLGVLLVPTAFSILWFSVFGGLGFYVAHQGDGAMLEVVRTNPADATFFLLAQMPLPWLTSAATIVAAFLFIVTSVVSAAYVLAMFSSGGDPNPPAPVKLAWGAVLGALGLVMILSDSIDAVKAIIALGAMPFVFIVSLLTVCLLKALRADAT